MPCGVLVFPFAFTFCMKQRYSLFVAFIIYGDAGGGGRDQVVSQKTFPGKSFHFPLITHRPPNQGNLESLLMSSYSSSSYPVRNGFLF